MKLTEDVLIKLGFRGEGRSHCNRPAYRLEVPRNKKFGYYHWDKIQIVLGNYPDSNPNSGILSVYHSEMKDMHCFTSEKGDSKARSKKIDHVMETKDGYRYGIKYVTFPEKAVPIAHHVTTLERLNQIYVALTGNPPLKITKKK